MCADNKGHKFNQPRLILSTVQIHRPRGDLPSIEPFLMANSREVDSHREHCRLQVEKAAKGASLPVTWAAALVASSKRVQMRETSCTASFISTTHLLTTR